MHISREGNNSASLRFTACVGLGLAAWIAASASAVVVKFRPEGSDVVLGDTNVAKSGGTFDQNVAVRTLVVGSKTLYLEKGDFREPVAVKIFAKSSDAGGGYDPVPDAELASPGSPFKFALSSDIATPPGMTALDAVSSPDFGRMMRPEGGRATRMQVFLPTPEKDDNELGDDEGPELMVMSAVPGVSMTVTPILAGNADDPASLIFGSPKSILPTTMAAGLTPVSMVLGGDPAPQQISVVGLDMSGDLGTTPGQTVVGYQLDVPQGSSFPVKLVPVGTQVLTPLLAAEEGMTQEVGDVFLASIESPALPGAPLDLPAAQAGTDYASNLEPFQESDQGFNTPPVPPLPPVPAPGVATLVLTAAAMMRRRRVA